MNNNLDLENYTKNNSQNELIIWEGNPSNWIHIWFYFLSTLLIPVFGIGLLLILWRYLDTRCHKIKITNERIVEEKGIFSVSYNELELYRVKDITQNQPFFLRIFSLSNIQLNTSDITNPVYVLKGIYNGLVVRQKLRKAIEIRRVLKNIRELDVN